MLVRLFYLVSFIIASTMKPEHDDSARVSFDASGAAHGFSDSLAAVVPAVP